MHSVPDLPSRGPLILRKDLLKGKSLEDLATIGGVSLLLLPPKFAAAQLAVPTGLCAAATYILHHGKLNHTRSHSNLVANEEAGCTSPGIFRVNGQTSIVNKLYDFYACQFEEAEKSTGPGQAQKTAGSTMMPSHIAHNVYDVASLFKKFLNGIPGGILGSLSLFTALESISNHVYPSDVTDTHLRKLRGRLIALAISSVTSQHRISLICAVVGLVSLIGHESSLLTNSAADPDADEIPHTELMGYQALGLVFAPLVIGELTDEIEVQPGKERRQQLTIPSSPSQMREDVAGPQLLPTSSVLDRSGERYKISANVMEMLLVNWREVVPQLRNIGAMEGRCIIGEPKHTLLGKKSVGGLHISKALEATKSVSRWANTLKVKKSNLPSTTSLDHVEKPSQAEYSSVIPPAEAVLNPVSTDQNLPSVTHAEDSGMLALVLAPAILPTIETVLNSVSVAPTTDIAAPTTDIAAPTTDTAAPSTLSVHKGTNQEVPSVFRRVSVKKMVDDLNNRHPRDGASLIPAPVNGRGQGRTSRPIRVPRASAAEEDAAAALLLLGGADRVASNAVSTATTTTSVGSTDVCLRRSSGDTTGSAGSSSALHEEIRRLQRQLALRTGEAVQARSELAAMRAAHHSGALMAELRASRAEAQKWQRRAQWAEKRLAAVEAAGGRKLPSWE